MFDIDFKSSSFTSILSKLKRIDVKAIVRYEINRALSILENDVKDNLSGKLVNVISGRLRNSFKKKYRNSNGFEEWEFGSKLSYAKTVEEGLSGLQKIKEHARKTKYGTFKVSSHERNVNRDGKFYFRSALSGFKERTMNNIHSRIRSELEK